jgi:hypothetical protein
MMLIVDQICAKGRGPVRGQGSEALLKDEQELLIDS